MYSEFFLNEILKRPQIYRSVCLLALPKNRKDIEQAYQDAYQIPRNTGHRVWFYHSPFQFKRPNLPVDGHMLIFKDSIRFSDWRIDPRSLFEEHVNSGNDLTWIDGKKSEQNGKEIVLEARACIVKNKWLPKIHSKLHLIKPEKQHEIKCGWISSNCLFL